MRGLSIRQPWTWGIVNGKPVENRTWTTTYRGEFALHASGRARCDSDGEYSPLVREAWRRSGYGDSLFWRGNPAFVYGAVIAVADLADVCAVQAEGGDCGCGEWSAWGQYHWRLANIRPLAEPVPCKGALGLWTLPGEVEQAVRAQLAETVRHG